jgi:hypothetical protein
MKRLKNIVFATMLAAGFMVSPALANPKTRDTDKVDILGTWSMQTKPYREGQCLMTGTMRLTPHPEKGRYNCELTAIEVCSMWGRSVVRQSCEVRRFGNQVSIRSTILEMLEQKGFAGEYLPDNFSLTVQSSKRMYGALVSAVTAPVEFRRSENGIS